ncbi:MAG: DNA photolyase family protein [Opitutaceae bacterium]|nr:DNA photolyase family protein [Opitutaceae bacterium]
MSASPNAHPAPAPTLLWFRKDLRLSDNSALAAALDRGAPIIPVFIHDEAGEGSWPLGGASKWWLHHSLIALDARLCEAGSRLLVLHGDSETELLRLVRDCGAGAVFWNRRYEPAVRKRDAAIKARLGAEGVEAKSFNSALLNEPHTIKNKQGGPFQVFTPYWRHCSGLGFAEPVRCDLAKLRGLAPIKWPDAGSGRATAAEAVGSLALLPKIPWDAGFSAMWTPGEDDARARLRRFLGDKAVHAYDDERNLPDRDGTSGLSPHLHWGEIGPRQIAAELKALGKNSGLDPASNGARVYLSEIGWREFAYHLLYHFEHTPERPLRADFERFGWAGDADGAKLKAWQRGLTGYPIVDAGMRQLWTTGWMHNRVRMIVASFLVKHLRLPWQQGAAWFWDTLVDADLASNTLGWQWSAGCGADAAPYFRIFAPVTQGEKFDGAGRYVRRWVPELAKVPDKFLHAPWTAPANVLEYAKVELGATYPRPIVDHATARAEALAAFKALRSGEGASDDES